MKDGTNINLSGIGLLIVFLFALTFCGTPDLQDAIIQRVQTCK